LNKCAELFGRKNRTLATHHGPAFDLAGRWDRRTQHRHHRVKASRGQIAYADNELSDAGSWNGCDVFAGVASPALENVGDNLAVIGLRARLFADALQCSPILQSNG